MDLWIRSQEKTRLIKVNNILAYKFDDGSYGIQINSECFVGEYKTEKRALEVLDEIQKYINNECKFLEREQHTSMGTYINKEQMRVYEMPKE